MSRNSLYKYLMILIGVTLTSCAQYNTVPVATEPDLVGTRIAQAAEKASKALDTISGIEQQRFPIAAPENDYSSAPPSMMEPITVRWSGPIEQMVQTLASRAGMRFTTRGKQPPTPITITVDVYQQPLVEVLQSVGLQAGRRADIHVDAQANVIEIRYTPADKM